MTYKYPSEVRTLRLCVGTWEGDMNSLSANFLYAVARIVNAYGDALKDDLFKERIGAMSVKLLTRTAKERRVRHGRGLWR